MAREIFFHLRNARREIGFSAPIEKFYGAGDIRFDVAHTPRARLDENMRVLLAADDFGNLKNRVIRARSQIDGGSSEIFFAFNGGEYGFHQVLHEKHIAALVPIRYDGKGLLILPLVKEPLDAGRVRRVA